MKACYSKQKRFENQVKPRVIFAWVKDIVLSMAEQFGMGYKEPGFIITKQSGKEKKELSFIITKQSGKEKKVPSFIIAKISEIIVE